MKTVRESGLALFQSVFLMGAFVWMSWTQFRESSKDKRVLIDQADKIAQVVRDNTVAMSEMERTMQSVTGMLGAVLDIREELGERTKFMERTEERLERLEREP